MSDGSLTIAGILFSVMFIISSAQARYDAKHNGVAETIVSAVWMAVWGALFVSAGVLQMLR